MKIKKLAILLILAAFVANTAAQSGRRPIPTFDPDKKYLALTFDDGPTTQETVQILDELKRFAPNAKVTFYVNGKMFNDETMPVLKRIIAEGHDVCNHGFYHYSHGGSHPDSKDPSGSPIILDTPEKAIKNLQDNSQAIFDATGYWPFSFRAPFFEFGNVLKGVDKLLNMPFIHARYDTNDWQVGNQQNPQGMANALMGDQRVKNGGTIILMHDAPAGARQGTVNSLQHFIPQLIAQGYEFVTVRELFAIKRYQPEVFQSATDTHNPNPGIPTNEHSANGRRWNHEDFWPDDKDDWWLQNWWSCPTPPWKRANLSDCDGEIIPPPPPAEIVVNFEPTQGVSSAKVNGVPVTSGTQIIIGQTITFTANPPEGYRVANWTINGAVVPGAVGNEFNYTVSESSGQTINIDVNFEPHGETSITSGTKKLKTGLFKNNVVSEKMEIMPEFAVTEVIIYDALGNVVHNSAFRIPNSAFVWDLRNSAGRFVANGSYLVIVEAMDRDGKLKRYSGMVGVKR